MPDPANALAESIRGEIAQRGPIPFAEFMKRALYDPAHGYYGSGRARLGRGGDFFTNVSVGPLFGQLLARQFVELWVRLGLPGEFAIVEQGAHHGDFASDVLGALRETAPECFAATTYWLVEPLVRLRAVQQEKLASFGGNKVRWTTTLAELPPFTGVHFSNELLDAFPVHRVVRRGDQWRERAVDLQDDRFVFVDAPFSTEALREPLAHLPAVPPDYETEINLAAPAWIAEVASRLERGIVLTIDYGFPRAEYYRPERSSGTLSAYAGHQRESDPLARPGEIDLTSHVEFTSLAEAALAAGLELAGFTDQHHFMVGLGQLHFSGDAASPKEVRAFKTLMHPNLMGRSFRALCFAKSVSETRLAGFQFSANASKALIESE